MSKILCWLDENLLLCLSLFLVVFIPLWPKIPLFQIIPGYIVRVRLEDVAVGLTGVVFLIQLIRKKVSLETPLTTPMLAYLLVGFLSLLSAFFLIKSLPILPLHAGKAFLHLLRYAEYFSIFFFVFFAIKKPQHLQLFLIAFSIVILATAAYGVGQKYFQFPVYSTMNYEFSSGEPLELINPQSRVQSTFAGHYDFAIYLDLLLPMLLMLLYVARQPKHRAVLAIIFAVGVWSLIVSGLRSAFASYLVMIFVVTALLALAQTGWRQRLSWFGVRMLSVTLFTGVMFMVFGNNLLALLTHAGGIFASKTTPQTIDDTIISQYQLPVPKDEVEAYKLAGGTKPADLSGCAKEKEISLCIRLESLWPQAIHGFQRMPLLGSGYSSLNKRDFNHLSEADGTDNQYLRWLGETGVLGLATFVAILVVAGKLAIQKLKGLTVGNMAQPEQYLAVVFVAVLVGIAINALLFDVFAASKVAFGFWAVTGLCLGVWNISQTKTKKAK